MGVAAAVRERDRAGGSSLEQVWPSDPLLGSPGPAQRPDDRSWRQSPDGARGATRARSVREYGFLGVVIDSKNLEGSIWTWWREGGKFHIEKTVTIPPEPASKDQLPPLLQGFGAVPPLVTDIDLSMDDRFLYVACWGTGEMRQYDVT